MAGNISNPYLPSPAKADAWAEGFSKAFLSISSPQPGDNVLPDDYYAFNEGVSTGLICADEGIMFGNACIAYGSEHDDTITYIKWTGKTIKNVSKFFLKKVASGVAGLIVTFLEISLHTSPPVDISETVLPSLGQSVLNKLNSYGIDSIELFCGVGIDYESAGCEILLTPLYVTVEKTKSAVSSFNRPESFVVSWRTDQSNSFRVVE
jgi:hypothetical protein